MSLAAWKLVWEYSRANGSALVILLALADHANEAFEAWPSASTLARLAKLTDRQVRSILHALVKAGDIAAVGIGPRGVTRYRITCGTPEAGFTPEVDFTPPLKSASGEPLKPASPNPSSNHQGTIKQGARVPGERTANGNRAGAPNQSHLSAAFGSQAPRTGATFRKGTGAAEIDAAFAEFKRHYPSRAPHANPVKPAREAFAAAVKRGADPAAIIQGAENYAVTVDRERTAPRFVAQAVTWLRQERWNEYQRRPEPARQDDGLC